LGGDVDMGRDVERADSAFDMLSDIVEMQMVEVNDFLDIRMPLLIFEILPRIF
jgi:hypothetical protein